MDKGPMIVAIVIGWLSQPALMIWNVSKKGMGIVRSWGAESSQRPARTVLLAALVVLVAAVAVAWAVTGEASAGIFLAAGPGMMPGGGGPRMINPLGVLGRNQGPELFTQFAHNGQVADVRVPRPLNLNRPLEMVIVEWAGRIVVANNPFTAVAAEAPTTLIQRVTIRGTWKGTAVTPIDISGATAYGRAYAYGLQPSIFINGVRQAPPTSPYAQLAANFGNVGTYDVRLFIPIPVWPVVSPANRAFDQARYLWQSQDWNDSLEIALQLGDETALGTPNAPGDATFTAIGSAAGTPTVRIHTRSVLLGDLRFSQRSNVLLLSEQPIRDTVTTLGGNLRIARLDRQKTPVILLKTGTILAGSTPGVQVFATLTDALLDQTLVVVDNRRLRDTSSNFAAGDSIQMNQGAIRPQGYLPLSFIDGQSSRTALRADLAAVVGPGSDFALWSSVLTTGATQALNMIQESIWADADDPWWLG